MEKTVQLTINNRTVHVEAGLTLMEAACSQGIPIPHLCHHPAISALGTCRLCVVEVEGGRNLPASCTTPVQEGMVVWTESERVIKARQTVLDLILANHPLDCLTCEKNGDCRLQDYAYQYGLDKSSFDGARRQYPKDESNSFFIRDHEKCILCGRCVNLCAERVGSRVYDFGFRGFESKVVAGLDSAQEESSCVFCGNCISVCPTGALQPKMTKGKGRIYQLEEAEVICPYCGVGCALKLQIRAGQVVGALPANGPANKNLLCVKGRFGLDFVQHPDRLTKPLIRKDGILVEATWEEVLSYTANRLQDLKDKYGPAALAGISSTKCSNEENYLFQKFMRTVLGTNNVDNSARLCHASTISGLSESFGSGAATNTIAELAEVEVFLIVGTNTTENHPVIGFKVLEAQRKGAKVIVVDPRRTDLGRKADIFLQLLPGTDVALLNGLLHVIVSEELYDNQFIAERTEGFPEMCALVQEYTPAYVEKITGVPAADVINAARLYATSDKAAILYAMGITQHTTGTDNVRSIANLAMATGNVGRENTGVYPLRGQNNVQGACDMGTLPSYYPGYQKVNNPEIRDKLGAFWGVELPAEPGLSVMEMMDAARAGTLKGMYIMGENPMLSSPDLNAVEKSLRNLEFLVVQDIFLTETAQLAHVVLPGASFAEKDGTYVNTERRVQLVRQAISPIGESLPDWQIICQLSTALGQQQLAISPAEIMEEISHITPSYGGVSYSRLAGQGLQWPCLDDQHPGTPYLHKERFTRGKGQFVAAQFQHPHELPDEAYPLIFVTGRHLYHYHTGTMSRRSKGLEAARPEAYVEINPVTAAGMGVENGEYVLLESRRGSIKIKTKVTERIPERIVFVPFHYKEAAANLLTNSAFDKIAQIPELKVCAARLVPLEKGCGN